MGNIKSKEIVAARRIKKLMSGKPTAKGVTHPPFPGTEEVLLRAQIARISADVTLMFKDSLKREGNFGDEDATEPAPDEDNPDNPDNKLRKRMLAEQESDSVRDPIRRLE